MNNKRIYLIIGIITVTTLILGVTTAWFTWRSKDDTKFILSIGDIAEVIYQKGNDITSSNIGPVLDYNDGEVGTFSFKKRIDNPLGIGVYINIVKLPNELKEESLKVILLKSTNNIKYTLVEGINLKDKEENNRYLVAQDVATTSLTYYKVIIYIDGNMENPNTMMNKALEAKIEVDAGTGACGYLDDVEPSAPVLASGMIPIKWNGTTWVKADSTNSDNDWYNYDNKMWANAVMVSSDTRDSYMSDVTKPIGSEVLESDILAYYVWIPRYKYILFNVNALSTSQKEICMQFENKETPKQTGSANGSWLTHPAFTFDTDELEGIWVGKFETSVDTNDACYTNSSTTNCNKRLSNPRIKPNMSSLVYQNVSNQFLTAQSIGTDTYLTTDGISSIDAHMMKNIEWGAVAYLKQSKYGLGTIRTGNNAYKSDTEPYYMTGCGPVSETNLIDTTTTCTSYTSSVGVKSSTTGNVTGVYDMAGGAREYVMGVTTDNTGKPLSGNDNAWNSGFTGKVYSNGTYTNYIGIDFPDSKYYNLYAFGITYMDQDAYNRRILGDATGETRGWDGSFARMANKGYTWVYRGGSSIDRTNAGVFCFNGHVGGPNNNMSFRITLANIH